MISVSVRQDKHGVISARISIADTFLTDITTLENCDVMFGSEEYEGQVRFAFHKDGAFSIKNGPGGGRMVTLPNFEGLPKKPWANLPCKLVSHGKGEFVFKLPIEEWTRASTPLLPAPTVASVVKAPVRTEAQNIDAVEYLTKKGHKIHKMAGGRWQLDGDTVTTAVIVEIINEKRVRQQLPKITERDLA